MDCAGSKGSAGITDIADRADIEHSADWIPTFIRSFLVLLLSLLFLLNVKLQRVVRPEVVKLPPSPPTLPLIGNILIMIKEIKKGLNPCEIFSNMAL